MAIRNVIICGLGALGLTYANKLKSVCNLKILANSERVEKYKKNIPILNGNKIELDYIIPREKFDADLIIITTKSRGLDSAINYIKNFVSEKTIIISLINGISSEERLLQAYPIAQVLRSYFIGHSAMFNSKCGFYTQDGVGKIVFEGNKDLEEFFIKNNIDYEISNNMIYSQWVKLGVNIVINQLTAIYECTVGELRNRADYKLISEKLLNEIIEVAEAYGLKKLDNYKIDVYNTINIVADDGLTSMYQDILANKKTEVDIFSGEIIKLGKIYGIKTSYNENIYNKIKIKEEFFA